MTSLPTDQMSTSTGPTVHLLHRWDRHVDRLTLHRDYPAALSALAQDLRAHWHDNPRPSTSPESPQHLDDTEVVIAYYGTDVVGAPTAPHSADLLDDGGFTITEEPVFGPEPTQVSLRLGTLRVRDDDESTAVTYSLDAAGLTVEVSPTADGSPAVRVIPQPHLHSIPVTVHITPSTRSGSV